MKKIALFVPLALLVPFGAVGTNDANAWPTARGPVVTTTALPPPVEPGRFIITQIKGEITVPTTFSGGNYGTPAALAGFNCSNLVISAESKEMVPGSGQGLAPPVPVWTRHTNATGNWASGKCSYALWVKPDSPFSLNVGHTGNFNCDVVEIGLTNAAQYHSVPKGTVKVNNLTIPKVTCIVIG
jgi:hypothetical protein